MIQKIWGACFNSATIAVSYVGTALGLIYANLDNMAGAVVDPSIVTWVHSVIDGHPVIARYVFSAFGCIVIFARLRTLIKPKT